MLKNCKTKHGNKEVTMAFRVESDLRTRFSEAAELEHRVAVQVLRDFMRKVQ